VRTLTEEENDRLRNSFAIRLESQVGNPLAGNSLDDNLALIFGRKALTLEDAWRSLGSKGDLLALVESLIGDPRALVIDQMERDAKRVTLRTECACAILEIDPVNRPDKYKRYSLAELEREAGAVERMKKKASEEPVSHLAEQHAPPISQPGTWTPDKQRKKAQGTSRRATDKRRRIYAGMVLWRHKTTGKSIAYSVGETDGLISEASYHNYQKEQLAYSDSDVDALGTTFKELWSAFGRGELDSFIDNLLTQ
jgi:hypothetical protein